MHRSLRPIGLIATTALCLAISTALAPGLAVADDDEELLYARPGGYVMIHGMGGIDVDRRRNETNLTGGGGYLVRLGSRETEQLAWELAFEHFLPKGENEHAFVYGINAKYFFMQEALQPYLIVGANGYTRLRESQNRRTDWGFRMGAGMDLYLTKKWALNMEHTYVVGVGDLLRQEYGSFALGLLYRF